MAGAAEAQRFASRRWDWDWGRGCLHQYVLVQAAPDPADVLVRTSPSRCSMRCRSRAAGDPSPGRVVHKHWQIRSKLETKQKFEILRTRTFSKATAASWRRSSASRAHRERPEIRLRRTDDETCPPAATRFQSAPSASTTTSSPKIGCTTCGS